MNKLELHSDGSGLFTELVRMGAIESPSADYDIFRLNRENSDPIGVSPFPQWQLEHDYLITFVQLEWNMTQPTYMTFEQWAAVSNPIIGAQHQLGITTLFSNDHKRILENVQLITSQILLMCDVAEAGNTEYVSILMGGYRLQKKKLQTLENQIIIPK